ncbi:Receptor-type tyrosine- phosphatase F, partial [Paramuricea clavata]
MQTISYTVKRFFLARFPDKPTKLTVTNIKSTSAEISWAYPKNTGDYQASAAVLSGFFIKLKIGNCLIVNITTKKVNKRKLTNLSPYTTYEISVAAGNKRGGFGEETTTSFRTKITSARFPDKPTNLTVTNITSGSAEISWADPKNTGDYKVSAAVLTRFFIQLKKDNSLIRNITTDKANKRKLTNLTPNATYEISVAAGNQNGFGEETITSFTTLGKALLPDKPSKLTVTNITSESAGISWVDPANEGNNGLTGFQIKLTKDNAVILNITINKVNKYEIDNLTPNTTYEISVAAGNQNGFGETTITSFRTSEATSVTTFEKVDGVSLSYSSLPAEGFVQIKYGGTKNVCWRSLKNKAKYVVCRQLGYLRLASLVKKAPSSDNKDASFSGKINCAGGVKNLSQCLITNSTTTCSELSYIKCSVCPRPLLGDKQRFPDSSFTASASSQSRSPSDARTSSGSSWCAPAADGKHYLQVDLGRRYVIYRFATFGDSTSPKWVTTYKLNYTVDLINWKPVWKKKIRGNKNAYNDATNAYFHGGITTRALRFIPLTYVGQPCMRIEICGGTWFPDKPTNLTFTNITSRSADISWVDPENTGDNKGVAVLSGFFIKLKKGNSLIRNITTDKVNKRKLTNLTPNTTYQISVAAGNQNGFGEETITSFTTLGKALLPDKPSKLTVINITSESAGISWVDPANGGKNGLTGFRIKLTKDNTVILNITINKVNKYEIDNLTPNTTYEISVAAGNQNGFGETTITSFRTSEETSVTTFEKVDGVSLSYSSLPAEGFVQIKYGGTKNVCWRSLKNKAKYVVCLQLGYLRLESLVKKAPSSDNKDASFSGKINCTDEEKNLSHCLITTSTKNCTELSYIKCFICNRPLLEDKQTFPDSSFTASASSEGHSPSHARISSGSSWCAPISDGKHYLQVDLGRLYVIYRFATFGDRTSSKWVTTYKLNYTVDLINWNSVWKKKLPGNKNAYNDATIKNLSGGIRTRALRFIPLTYVGQPCMRIEICGGTRFPDKPTNLTVTNITSRSAEISWADPENAGDYKGGAATLSGFFIKLTKENSLPRNITTDKVNKWKLTNLTPYTTYEISVAAGNKRGGFGEETITSFTTLGKALLPDKPSKLTVTNITSESAGISWADPVNGGNNSLTRFRIKLTKDNTVILNITINKVNKYEIDNLTPNTTYEISVAAGNQNGFGETTITSFRTSEATSVTTFEKVDGVSLSYSSLPAEGFVQIKYGGTKNVCWRSLKNKAKYVVCRQLGYLRLASLVKKAPSSDNKDASFSGKINCAGGVKNLSQCLITNSTTTCSELSYIKCSVCPRPLLGDKQRFPDSSFTASASSQSRSPSDARTSSGSSWCAPAADGKHYLQVDLGRLYVIYRFATFGDSTSPKWVTTYKLNYTVDLINWKPVWKKKIRGNKNAYNDATNAYFRGGITTRALRFIPLTYVGQPCMRIEICGATRFPDKPTNLTFTNITSRSADISWVDPENTGDNKGVAVLSGFFIKLKKENSLIRNITTDKVNKRKLTNLTPNTTYQISVAAGNQNGFGEETTTSFTTLGKALLPDKPSKLTVINITSESAGISWVDPANGGKNGLTGFRIKLTKDNTVILNITINKVNKYEIDNLTPNTTYEISVAAGNQN